MGMYDPILIQWDDSELYARPIKWNCDLDEIDGNIEDLVDEINPTVYELVCPRCGNRVELRVENEWLECEECDNKTENPLCDDINLSETGEDELINIINELDLDDQDNKGDQGINSEEAEEAEEAEDDKQREIKNTSDPEKDVEPIKEETTKPTKPTRTTKKKSNKKKTKKKTSKKSKPTESKSEEPKETDESGVDKILDDLYESLMDNEIELD